MDEDGNKLFRKAPKWTIWVVEFIFIGLPIIFIVSKFVQGERLEIPVLFIFIAMMAMGVLLFFKWRGKESKIKDFKANGKCIRTVIDRVEVIETRRRDSDGHKYYTTDYLVVSKDESGREYQSKELTKASQDLVGKYVNVYVDPVEDLEYYMDFDSVSDDAVSD